MRRAAKSSIYRNQVTSYAVEAVLEAIAAIEAGHEAPAPMASDDPRIRVRGPCRQADRAIDWQHDTTVEVLRKIDSADRVRDIWPDPVRMIISGYSECEDIIAGLNEAGIYQYLTKPWQPDRLVDIVKKAVQLYRLQKETETGDRRQGDARARQEGRVGQARRRKAALRLQPCRAFAP